MSAITRRSTLLMGVAAALVAEAGAQAQAQAQAPIVDPFVPVPIPPPMAAKEGLIELPSGKVFVRDTGGQGPAVILMHPATGSALIWAYQEAAFAAAGHRVIAWSRRGHYGSDPVDKANPGSYARDIDDLANALGLSQFSLVASAAGCTISLDYAMSFPARLRKLVLSAGSLGNIEEPEIRNATAGSRLKGFDDLPADFRELSPAYRSANPAGAKAWVELEHKALSGNRQGPKLLNAFNWTTLGQMQRPTLLLYGGADLAAPTTIGRIVARRLPNHEFVVAPEAGHSIYWEQPAFFNRTVLDFLARA
jgi:pimeloyl-ACP methyl ester carboxylesterase